MQFGPLTLSMWFSYDKGGIQFHLEARVLQQAKVVWPRLRLVLSIVLLIALFSDVHWSTILPKRHGVVGLLLAAGLIALSSVFLSVLRWHRVLAALGKKVPLGRLLHMYLAALFVSNFLPSTVGGDIVRVTRLRRNSGLGDAMASVILERLTGWIVLPFLTIIGLLLDRRLFHIGTSARWALLIALVTLLALVVIVGIATFATEPKAENPGAIRSFIESARYGIVTLTTNPKGVVEVLGVSFLYQLAVVATALLVADALGLGLSVTVMLAFVPAIAILQVLPLTIGGLGLREGAFVLFFRPLGVSTSQAIALGLLLYFVNLLVSLIGAPAFALGNERGTAVVEGD